MASVSFEVIGVDLASRTFRGVGNAALAMAAKVRAANNAMEESWVRNTQAAAGWIKLITFGAPLIPPLITAIAVGVGALTSVLVSVAPGMGALGLAMVTTFAKIAKAGKDAKGPLGEAAKALDQVKAALKSFTELSTPTTLPIFTEAFRIMADLLPRLVPLVQSFGRVFLRALRDLSGAMQSPWFDHFLNWAARVGALNFDHLLRAMGNIGVTIINLARAFSGPGLGLTKWLEDVTGKWAAWSAQLNRSDGFRSFMAFFRENGPLLGQLLQGITTFLIRFVEALAPLSHITLVGLTDLVNLLNKIPKSYLTGIAAGFIAMRVALTAVTVATKAFSIAAKLGAIEARAFAIAMGLVDLAMDANPIVLITIAILALVAAFVIAYKKSATFRAIVQSNMRQVAGATAAMINVAKPALLWIANTGMPAVVRAAHGMSTAVHTGASLISAGMRGMMSVILSVGGTIVGIFARLTGAWADVLHALSKVPGFGWADAAASAMRNASGTAQNLAGSIAALRSKTITVTTHYVITHTTINSIINKQANDPRGAQQSSYARGGRPRVGMASLVGERGPELFVPDVPGTVITAHETANALKRGGSATTAVRDDEGTPLEVHLHLEGRTIVTSVLAYKRGTGNRSTGIG